jgi:hypothetical protein
MATISAYVQAEGNSGNPGKKPYFVEKEVDLVAVGADPSADDVIQVISIPANTMVLTAGLEVTEVAVQNTGTDATADLGVAADDDEWVAAFDIDGASVGDYAPMAAAATPYVSGAAETLDVTVAGTGASFTAGKLRVFALLLDIDAIGDKSAQEVSRDYLA